MWVEAAHLEVLDTATNVEPQATKLAMWSDIARAAGHRHRSRRVSNASTIPRQRCGQQVTGLWTGTSAQYDKKPPSGGGILRTSTTLPETHEMGARDRGRPKQATAALPFARLKGLSDCQTLLAASKPSRHIGWFRKLGLPISLSVASCSGLTMTMTHSEKSHIRQMKAWPYRQECRGHDPTKKNLFC